MASGSARYPQDAHLSKRGRARAPRRSKNAKHSNSRKLELSHCSLVVSNDHVFSTRDTRHSNSRKLELSHCSWVVSNDHVFSTRDTRHSSACLRTKVSHSDRRFPHAGFPRSRLSLVHGCLVEEVCGHPQGRAALTPSGGGLTPSGGRRGGEVEQGVERGVEGDGCTGGSPLGCGARYLRAADVGGLNGTPTGRVCDACGGRLVATLLDFDDSWAPDQASAPLYQAQPSSATPFPRITLPTPSHPPTILLPPLPRP